MQIPLDAAQLRAVGVEHARAALRQLADPLGEPVPRRGFERGQTAVGVEGRELGHCPVRQGREARDLDDSQGQRAAPAGYGEDAQQPQRRVGGEQPPQRSCERGEHHRADAGQRGQPRRYAGHDVPEHPADVTPGLPVVEHLTPPRANPLGRRHAAPGGHLPVQ